MLGDRFEGITVLLGFIKSVLTFRLVQSETGLKSLNLVTRINKRIKLFLRFIVIGIFLSNIVLMQSVWAGGSSGGGGGEGGGNVPRPPPSPSNVIVPSSDTDGYYTITWSGPTSWPNFRNFEVYEQHNDGSWSNVGGSTAVSLTLSGKPDGTYRYFVRTVDTYEQRSGNAYSSTFRVARVPGTPGSVSIPGTTTGSYSISWGAASGTVDYYQYRESHNGGAWGVWTNNGTSRSKSFSGKSNGTYSYQVRGCNTIASCGGNRSSGTLTVVNPPGSPGAMMTPGTTVGDFTVSWGAASGNVSRYEYRRSYNGGAYSGWSSNGLSRSLTYTNQADGAYRFNAKACNAGGCGGDTYSDTFTVINLPSIPSNLRMEWVVDGGGSPHAPGAGEASPDDGMDSYRLHWNTATGSVSRYEVEYQHDGGAGFSNWANIDSGTNLQLLRANQNNGTYNHRVRACNSMGCSGWSSTLTIQISNPPPMPNFTQCPSTDPDGQYEIQWSGTETDTYKLTEQRIGSSEITQLVDGLSTSITVHKTEAAQYQYRLSACKQGVCGSSVSCTVSLSPQTPQWLNTDGVGEMDAANGPFTLNWSDSGLEAVYTLTGGPAYEGSATSHTISSPTDGTYTFRVKACNPLGCSEYSEPKTVYVLTRPPVPDWVSSCPLRIRDGAFQFEWSDVGVTEHRVRRREGTTEESFILSGATVWSDSDIISDREYFYSVRACKKTADKDNNMIMECSAYSNECKAKRYTVTQPTQFQFHDVEYPAGNIDKNGSYTLTWSVGSVQAPIYELKRFSAGEAVGVVLGYLTEASYVDGQPKDNGSYYYAVRACINENFECSDWLYSLPVTVLHRTDPPAALPDTIGTTEFIPAIPGELSVAQNGAANYHVSIETPPGLGSANPNLSLSYNHQAGNGLLGHGWRLNGLSAIERCKRDWVHDGRLSGILDRHDYALCLDGSRLVQQGDGSYRTTNDQNMKIVAQGSGQNPDSFIVYYPNGSVAEFGNSTDSYWVGASRTDAFSWRIKSLRDLNGNEMHYHYTNDPSIGRFRIDFIDYGSNPAGQVDLALNIQFIFEARSDSPEKYVAGVMRKQSERLSGIELKRGAQVLGKYKLGYRHESFDPAQTSYLEQLEYCEGDNTCQRTEFEWSVIDEEAYTLAQGKTTWPITWSEHDQFIDVNADGLVDWVTFKNYMDQGFVIDNIHIAKRQANGQLTYELWDWQITPNINRDYSYNQINDINGDGLPDLMSLQSSTYGEHEVVLIQRGLHIAFADPNNPGAFIESNLAAGDAPPRPYMFRDTNSDGLMDIIIGPGNGPARRELLQGRHDYFHSAYFLRAINGNDSQNYQFNGSSYNGEPWSHGYYDENEPTHWWYMLLERSAAQYYDFDNDGYLDIITKNGLSVNYIGRNQYNQFANLPSFYTAIPDAYFADWAITPMSGSEYCGTIRFADVNGDGLVDAVFHCAPGVKVLLNTGEQGVAPPTGQEFWVPNIAGSGIGDGYGLDPQFESGSSVLQMLDFNNDGFSDRVWLENIVCSGLGEECTARVMIQYNRGQVKADGRGFTEAISWQGVGELINVGRQGAQQTARYTDINGDGFIDILTNSGNSVYLNPHKAKRIEKIRQRVGQGDFVDTDIEYQNLSGDSGDVYQQRMSDSDTQGQGSYQNSTFLEGGDALIGDKSPQALSIPIAKIVVSAVHRDNGVGTQNSTLYRYAGLRSDRYHGSLGFERIERIDTRAKRKSVSFYSQDAARHMMGQVVREQYYANLSEVDEWRSGDLLSDVQSQWALECLSGNNCVRDIAAIDADVGSLGIDSPRYRLYKLQENRYYWQVNSNHVRSADPYKASLWTANTTAPADCVAWNNNWTAKAADQISSEAGTYDEYGNLLIQYTLQCDLTGNFRASSVQNNSYLNHTDASWVIGLTTQNKITRSHNQAGGNEITQEIKFEYNTQGQLSEKTLEPNDSALKLVTTFEYHDWGNVKKRTESWDTAGAGGMDGLLSRSTHFNESFDHQAQLTQSIQNALTHQTSHTFDIWGRKVKVVDENGVELTTEYAAYNRKVSETVSAIEGSQQSSLKTEYYYQRCDGTEDCYLIPRAVAYLHIQVPGQMSERIYFDHLNREVGQRKRSLNGDYIYQLTQYDFEGRAYKVSQPWKDGDTVYWVTKLYDSLGRLRETHAPDGGKPKIEYGIEHPLRTSFVDAAGNKHHKTENILGQLKLSEDADGNLVTYQYDANGNLTRTDVAPHDITTTVTTTLKYDRMGRRIELLDPSIGVQTSEYNALGLNYEMTHGQTAEARTSSMFYDALGRMVKRQDPSQVQATQWWWDTAVNGVGKVAQLSGSSSNNTDFNELYAYTGFGLLKQTNTTISGQEYVINQIYDEFNRPKQTLYPEINGERLKVETEYTNHGHTFRIFERLSGGGEGTPYWMAEDDDALGNITESIFGNGVKQQNQYDPKTGRLLSAYAHVNELVVQHLRFGFSLVGNLMYRHDVEHQLSEAFCYDALNRLKGIQFGSADLINGLTDCVTPSQEYRYDGLSNLTYKEGSDYQYGTTENAGPYAVSAIGDKTYHYNLFGELTAVKQNNINQQEVNWTGFGKPTYFKHGDNITNIIYGPDRKRIQRNDLQDGVNTVTSYIHSLFEKVEEDNQAVKYRHMIDEVAVVIKTDDGSSDEIRYLHKDHLGSTTVMSPNGLGQADELDQLSYAAWGERRQPNGEKLENPLSYKNQTTPRGFTGHEHLDGVGVIHMNGRVYDPFIGRFLSPDPFVQAPELSYSFNRYSYIWNNPLSGTDPSGNIIMFVPVAIKAVSWGMTAYAAYQTTQSAVDTVEGLKSGELTVGEAVKNVGATALEETVMKKAKVLGKLIPEQVKQKGKEVLKNVTDTSTKKNKGDTAPKDEPKKKGAEDDGSTNDSKKSDSCCFVAGTLVLTKDGYKNIEDVKLGEYVWAKNTDTGEEEWKAVTKIWIEKDRGIYDIRLLTTDGQEQKIQATDDHPFFVIGEGWKDTIELQPGDQIETNLGTALTVISVTDENRDDITYNFTVEDFHTYYVTQRNVLVHNCGDDKPVEKYEVGEFNDLKGRSEVGDGLDVHHAVQKHPAGQVIEGYDPKTAPSIAVPSKEHGRISTLKGEYEGSARDLLAKDIKDMRANTNAPNEKLKELIDLNKEKFPEAFQKE